MYCVEKLYGIAKTGFEAVKKDDYVKMYIAVAVACLLALWYILRPVPDGGTVADGFDGARSELQSAGNSVGAIAAGIGRSEDITGGLDAGIDRIGDSAVRVTGSVNRAKSRVVKAQAGAGEAEKRIIAAENRVVDALRVTDESRAIIERCREKVQEGK